AIKAALKRNEFLRNFFVREISEYSATQLVFCDKTAANERVGDRKRVWVPKGQKRVNPLPFSEGEKYSILPAFTVDGFLCQDIIQGSFTTGLFFYFVRDILLPQGNPFPASKSVIIMDNAQVHRHSIIREMIEEAGYKLIMLPPYSPDYNPIEIAFSIMKKWIIRHHIEFVEAIVMGEMDLFLVYAMSTISSRQAESCFKHCGY
ncbi:unnamed protein product, partial [Tuber aestivum]